MANTDFIDYNKEDQSIDWSFSALNEIGKYDYEYILEANDQASINSLLTVTYEHMFKMRFAQYMQNSTWVRSIYNSTTDMNSLLYGKNNKLKLNLFNSIDVEKDLQNGIKDGIIGLAKCNISTNKRIFVPLINNDPILNWRDVNQILNTETMRNWLLQVVDKRSNDYDQIMKNIERFYKAGN